MDMARKFLPMGYTRSRRYANQKATSAKIFYEHWMKVESDSTYVDLRTGWKILFG
jgi:hypothetical protein